MGHRLARGTLVAGILGFSSFANAQSSVTLYGSVDVGVYYQNRSVGNQGKLFTLVDSGSTSNRWGLLGTEDLGGGLHAGFRLESGFLATTGALGHGNGNFFGRQAYVSVDGNFGSVTAGLQYSPFYLVVADNDPQGNANQGASPVPYLSNLGKAGVYTSSVATYTTPVIYGFSGSLMFGPGGVAGNFNSGKQISASARYANHGLSASIAYLNIRDASGHVAQEGRIVAAKYTWGSVTVNGMVTNYRTPTAGQPLSPTIRNVNVYTLGGSVRPTPFIVLSGGVYYSHDQDHGKNKSFLYSLNGQYLLSRRTYLYTIVSLVHNQGLMGTGVSADVSPTGGFSPGNTVGVAMGINHRF
ncbi:porin [Burkholderia sp. SG-MS1]|uniref:porin n=1 Tax=Paraburkholderia sp. SG-MS1 TaxID=2023741 RepID=UPI001446A7B0|nr:porin [Paraburkholderia sp. SG-MS1]NKJ49124.1 porin [Paraburkholderia sp. SG-MS1]